MGRRRRPTAGLTEEMVLARLAGGGDAVCARALRRYEAWRQAAETGCGATERRALRRAWERARDEALIALGADNPTAGDDRPR